MFVGRPRRSRLEWEGASGWEVAHLLAPGHADFVHDDVSEADWRAQRRERKEALRRKRPAGFAPWPEEVN